MVPHTPGASNTAGAINTAGTSSSDAAGANSTASASGMLLALALQGVRIMAGGDNNPGASGLAGTN
jgi:hypothetical protein